MPALTRAAAPRGIVSPPFAAEAFTLYESRLPRHGAHYEVVASYALETD